MSYYNKGSMAPVALVTSEKGGGNFTFVAGTDDPSVAIENAWSYLNDLGGGTLLTKGPGETWTLESTINSQGDNITWMSDWSLLFWAANGLDDDMIKNTNDWITFYGLHLNHNKANQAVAQHMPIEDLQDRSEHIRVLYCKIIDAVRSGVTIRWSDYVEYAYNYLEGGAWNNLTARDCTHVNIHNNLSYKISDVHISIFAGEHVDIHDNICWDTSLDTGDNDSKWGISVESGVSISVDIHDNILYDIGKRAIDIGNQTGDYNNISVRNNVMYDCAKLDSAVIRLRNCNGIDVVDNMFYNCAYIDAAALGHIQVLQSDLGMTDWRISDNHMLVDENPTGNLYGINVEDNSGGVIQNNKIYFSGTGGNQYGVYLDNMDDVLLEGNVIFTEDDYCIYVLGNSTNIHINGGQLDGGGSTGIYGVDVDDITVRNVVFKPNIGTAVDFNRASVTGPVIMGCYAKGVTADYSIAGAVGELLRDNIALGGGWFADT